MIYVVVFLVRFWQSLHFYLIHRLIHVAWIFKRVHHLYRRYFECNYGSEEIPIDRWFSSFHDEVNASNEHIRVRKKSLISRKYCLCYKNNSFL